MRSIKFRAWTISGGRMLPADDNNLPVIDGAIEPGDILDGGRGSLFVDGCDGRIVLMQFTGLYDKNGKEIYEGDVVRCGDSIAVVEWDENIDQDFYWGNASGFVFNFDPDEMKSDRTYEVIGNIYENPELIK